LLLLLSTSIPMLLSAASMWLRISSLRYSMPFSGMLRLLSFLTRSSMLCNAKLHAARQ
jgi:hypothetical protein